MAEAPTSRLPGLLGKLGKMTSIRDTEVLEQSLLRTLGPLLGVLDTSLYRTDDQLNMVRVINYHRSKVIEADGVARMVERVEEVSRLNDLPTDVIALTDNVRLLGKPCTRRIGDDYLVAYPLFGGNDVCGYFVFQRDREVQAAEDATIRGVLEVFSNYYALLDISQRDRLTGLFNRQAMESSFDRIWRVLGRPDQFHEREDGRRSAPADRYGGEEFVAIITAENAKIARNVFERVRLAIEAHIFPQIEHLTISIGYCQATQDILPVEVLSRADRSLYQAKQDGRNRIYAYHDLLEAGIFQEAPCADAEFRSEERRVGKECRSRWS